MTFALRRGLWIRQLRLGCGLVLFAFLLTHFANHAVGLVSLEAMESARRYFLAPWQHAIGEWLLRLALIIHWLLGLWQLYRRRTLRMPVWEATQILFGLAVPPLLIYHIIGVNQTSASAGTEALYTWTVLYFWVLDPMAGLRQLGLFTVAWIHGCIGLHFWLRIRGWYRQYFPTLLTLAVMLPVVALLGITQAGREVSQLAADPTYIEQLKGSTQSDGYSYGYGSETTAQTQPGQDLKPLRNWLLLASALAVLIVLIARLIRSRRTQSGATVRIRYLGGPLVQVPLGWSLLEASRSNGIAHASVCGGRARCSTCRVRIAGDPDTQPEPGTDEKRLLTRINAAPNVRLACQLRPTDDVTISPLLPVTAGAGSPSRSGGARGGEERDVTVLFADLRGFTRVAERKLPYDVVFLLNRYFEAVGSAVADSGGVANQYTGDGVMALFGVQGDPEVGCRQAIRAAGEMISRVERLSNVLGAELEDPLRIGIGIHIGPAVVGEMGYAGTRYLTAVGDTVNTTSRLESLTKEFSCELIVSAIALQRAGLTETDYPHHDLLLRNREATLDVVVVAQARELAAQVTDPGSA